MDENLELLEYIYQDAEMAVFSNTKLLDELNGKDNKIKPVVEDILKEYEKFLKDTKEEILKINAEPKSKGVMAKMGSSMGIKKEVIHDNSDSSIADMLIKGITMGTIDMQKKIDHYQDRVEKEIMKLAEDFLEFQQDCIDDLKDYL